MANIKYKHIFLSVLCFSVGVASGILASARTTGGSENNLKFPEPIEVGVEEISKLRSKELKPERAAPIIYGEMIFVFSSRKKLVSFNLQGKKVGGWELSFAPLSTPVAGNGRLYSGGDDGKFHCLELSSGKELWSYNLKTIDLSPPVLNGPLVIFQTANDRIVALEAETGKWRWEYQHLREDDLAVRGLCPALVKDETVYVGLSGGSIVALEADSGKLIWKKRVFRGGQFLDIDAELLADESNLYVFSVGGLTAAVSRKTGKVFWTYQAGGMAGGLLEGNTIYLATDNAEILALNKITGRPTWTAETADPSTLKFLDLPMRPLLWKDSLFALTRAGRMMLLEKKSGKIITEYNYHTDTSCGLVQVPGTGILALDNKGILRLWRFSDFGFDL